MDVEVRLTITSIAFGVRAGFMPGATGKGVRVVGREGLADDTSVPFRYRNVLGLGCNSVPERLGIVDLLIDGKCIEPGRWGGDYLEHVRFNTQVPVAFRCHANALANQGLRWCIWG